MEVVQPAKDIASKLLDHFAHVMASVSPGNFEHPVFESLQDPGRPHHLAS